jgi:hypothetical protein
MDNRRSLILNADWSEIDFHGVPRIGAVVEKGSSFVLRSPDLNFQTG